MIESNTFAASCFNDNSYNELINALLLKKADETDCKNWNITPTEWRKSKAEALKQKIEFNDLDCDDVI